MSDGTDRRVQDVMDDYQIPADGLVAFMEEWLWGDGSDPISRMIEGFRADDKMGELFDRIAGDRDEEGVNA